MISMGIELIIYALFGGFVLYIIYKLLAKYIRPKRQPVEDIPRDSMTNMRRDIFRSARISKPFNLRELRISGDGDVPNTRIGQIVGLLPMLNYYIVVYRRRGHTRTLLAEREFVRNIHGYTLTITARGVESHGELWDFPIPLDDFAAVLGFGHLREDEQLNQLWLQRAAAVQILMEQHASIERIEIRRHAETRAVLPKAATRVMLAGRYEEMQDV